MVWSSEARDLQSVPASPAERSGEERPDSNTMDAEEYRIKGEQGEFILTTTNTGSLLNIDINIYSRRLIQFQYLLRNYSSFKLKKKIKVD